MGRTADDVLPALAELDGEVSVLVTDVSMPGSMDGLALARHAGRAVPGLPVIVVSGSDGALAAAAAEPSVVATLAKPFALPELVALTVRAAVGRFRPG